MRDTSEPNNAWPMQDAAASTSNLTFGDKDLDRFQAQTFVGKKQSGSFCGWEEKTRPFFRESSGHGFFCMGFFHEDLRYQVQVL